MGDAWSIFRGFKIDSNKAFGPKPHQAYFETDSYEMVPIMNSENKTPKKTFSFLLSPWAIIAGLATGFILGIFFPNLSGKMSPIGTGYLSLLKMCIIPIMVSAIISSVTKLFSSGASPKFLTRIILVFTVALFISSLVGFASGIIGKPGSNLDPEAQKTIGTLIRKTEGIAGKSISPDLDIYVNDHGADAPNRSKNLVTSLIPENIFESLNLGNNIQILFFSIIFGVALSFITSKLRDRVINDLDAVFQTFELIISWLMFLLPIGLCFLTASQVSEIGIDVFTSMTKYIVWIYVACFLLIILNAIALSHYSGHNLLKTFRLLKEPLLVAFFTRYGFAAMPSAIDALKEEFQVSSSNASLIIPIGITVYRFGSVLAFSLSSLFLAQLFSLEINVFTSLIIIGGAVLAGLASAGAPGLVSVTMIGIILEPLGLPLEVAIVLLLAAEPISDPILTFANVHTNCTACTVIEGKNTNRETKSKRL